MSRDSSQLDKAELESVLADIEAAIKSCEAHNLFLTDLRTARFSVKKLLSSADTPSSLAHSELIEGAVAIIKEAQAAAYKMKLEGSNPPHCEVDGLMKVQAEMEEWLRRAGACPGFSYPEHTQALARLRTPSAHTPAATARFESDITTVRLLLDGFKDETPIKEVRAMLDRQFGAPTDTAFRIRSANPINDAAPGVSAQGASDGQEGLMGDGPNPPSAAVAASPSSTPPTSARNEWREAVIDALVVNFIYAKEHDDNPRKALNDLLAWEQTVALDPKVSSAAQALIDQGRALASSATANNEMARWDLVRRWLIQDGGITPIYIPGIHQARTVEDANAAVDRALEKLSAVDIRQS